jgi:hypothetical protein
MLVEHVGDGDMEVVDALLCGSAFQLVNEGADDFGCSNEALVPALPLNVLANYLHDDAKLGLS